MINDKCSLSSQVLVNEIGHQLNFALRKDAVERKHPITAVADLLVDLVGRFKFEIARPQAWHDFAVGQGFAFAFGSVTQRAMLPIDRNLVFFAFRDHESFSVFVRASKQNENRKERDD